MCAVKDKLIEIQETGFDDRKAPACENCEGKGFIEKTEWVGDDTSFDIEVRCICKEN